MSKKKEHNEEESYRPEWTPEDAGDEFAVRVVKGSSAAGSSKKQVVKKRRQLSVDEYAAGVLANERTVLARAITLIESNSPEHRELSQQVLSKLLPKSGNSIRVGITGFPGAGKSTLIEALGMFLIEKGHKVAVLTVDPSSSVTKGSILGDKTRMERLSREPNCFIRPSPSGGALGGVARKSRETITVCEAAGYDVILIETVGVGQNEITVRSMVDFFLLVFIAGAGDELQGIKKGVIEIADALLINKADGENETRANRTKTEFSIALHYLKPATKGWKTDAYTASAIKGKGIRELWELILQFERVTKESGVFEERRKEQALDWTFSLIEEALREQFYQNQSVKTMLPKLRDDIKNGILLPTAAAEKLLRLFRDSD